MDEQEKPKKSTDDAVRAIVKAGISAIPIAGAPAAEIFSLVVTPPHERRRDEWIESIGNGLKELAEKVEALKNAVLNAALPNAPEEDLQLMFLAYVDSLTTWHSAILEFLDNPKQWGEKYGITYPNWSSGGANAALEHAFSNLRGKRELYDVFIRDLHSRGLISTDNLHISGTGESILASRTTTMGRQFLSFISSPLD